VAVVEDIIATPTLTALQILVVVVVELDTTMRQAVDLVVLV
jgi:hypothetical protein